MASVTSTQSSVVTFDLALRQSHPPMIILFPLLSLIDYWLVLFPKYPALIPLKSNAGFLSFWGVIGKSPICERSSVLCWCFVIVMWCRGGWEHHGVGERASCSSSGNAHVREHREIPPSQSSSVVSAGEMNPDVTSDRPHRCWRFSSSEKRSNEECFWPISVLQHKANISHKIVFSFMDHHAISRFSGVCSHGLPND